MTEKLDDFFNQESTPIETKEVFVVDTNKTPLTSDNDRLVLELADVTQHSLDMDNLATKAMDVCDEVLEMARNAEERNVSEILNAAANMKKIALDAKNSKMKAMQKSAEILLKKRSMDEKKELEDADVIDEPQEGNDQTFVGDRNSIMKILQKPSE